MDSSLFGHVLVHDRTGMALQTLCWCFVVGMTIIVYRVFFHQTPSRVGVSEKVCLFARHGFRIGWRHVRHVCCAAEGVAPLPHERWALLGLKPKEAHASGWLRV